MKAFFLKILFSKMGQPIAGAISVIAGAVVHFVVSNMATYLHYAMPAEDQIKLAEGTVALCYAGINVIIHKYAGDKAEAIQKAVGVTDDRWIGDETVAAINKHVEFAKKPEIIPE